MLTPIPRSTSTKAAEFGTPVSNRLVDRSSLTIKIPRAVLQEMAQYLSPRSLKFLAEVCKEMRQISDSTFKKYLNTSPLPHSIHSSNCQKFFHPQNRIACALTYDRRGRDHLAEVSGIKSAAKLSQIRQGKLVVERLIENKTLVDMVMQTMINLDNDPENPFHQKFVCELICNEKADLTGAAFFDEFDLYRLENPVIQKCIYDDLLSVAEVLHEIDFELEEIFSEPVVEKYLLKKMITPRQVISYFDEDAMAVLKQPGVQTKIDRGEVTVLEAIRFYREQWEKIER
ncbi:hypothetical protein AAKU67_002990 [Oxalobacteraceae bacterium GrIS 2.11]